MTQKKFFAGLAYVAISMLLGLAWHLVIFKEAYSALGIYDRPEPIIPIGFLSMLLQAFVLAHLYHGYYRGGAPVGTGIRYGLLMGIFLFSISTLANAAKIHVNDMGTWILLQAAFHSIQFVAAGAAIGAIFGRIETRSV